MAALWAVGVRVRVNVLAILAAVCVCSALPQVTLPTVRANVYRVEDYGAKPDNTTVNTVAFRSAAVAAGNAGGPAVLLVAGPGTYKTGAFNLTSNVTLVVDPAATIFGVQDASPSQYPIIAPLPSYGTSRDVGYARHQALIMSPPGTVNIRITGGGTINGGGRYWWDLFRKKELKVGRPRLIELYNTSGIEVDNVRLVDSGFWTLHPVYSRDVHIHDLHILAPVDSPNTDGVDPDSSSNVLIERCTISCGDDHIAIKSGLDAAGRAVGMPSRNITIRDNVHLLGRGLSIGSEVSGGVEDVVVTGVRHLGPSEHGLHIKTASTRGGYVRNVRYENVVLGEIEKDAMFSLTTSYGHEEQPLSRGSGDNGLTDIVNLSYINITTTGKSATAKGAATWSCFSDKPCDGITLHDVNLDPAKGWKCDHVKNGKADSVKPDGVCL
eukprot:m.96644 g.96644  ORF g.96644 m.96644 type:complete len:438 (-) comp15198_c0_seq1:125-1438(-)